MVYRFSAADIAGWDYRPLVRGLNLKAYLQAEGRRRETTRTFSRWNSFSCGLGSSTVVTSGLNWAFFAQNQEWYGFLKSEKMTLRSALEDLLETTLAGVAGIAGKIEYVASLRDTASGAYSHWGLTRAYGEPAAQHALAEAHRLAFLGLLRTPLRTLRDDVIVSSGVLQITAGEYVERLRNRAPALLPPDLGGGSARHFSSVLQALSILLSEPVKTPSEPIPPA